MDDIIQRVINFFTSTAHSIGKKLIIAILALIVIVLINDHFGISYYYFTNMKIEHFRKIEEAKSYCANDSSLVAYFNEIEHNSLNRKTYIAKFLELFEKKPKTSDIQPLNNGKKKNTPKFIERLPENPSRLKIWNTITATPIAVYLLIISFCAIIFAFTKKDLNHRRIIVLAGFFMIFLSLLLGWIFQFILGSIPVIYERAYINYIINFLINVIAIIIVNKQFQNKKKPG